MKFSYEEFTDLAKRVRHIHGRCLDLGGALEVWRQRHPQSDIREARLRTPGFCAPRPSIRGNGPVYPDRPFYDARTHESLE